MYHNSLYWESNEDYLQSVMGVDFSVDDDETFSNEYSDCSETKMKTKSRSHSETKSTFILGGFKPSFSKIRLNIHPVILELSNSFNQREELLEKLKEEQLSIFHMIMTQSGFNHSDYLKNLEDSYSYQKNEIESDLSVLENLYSQEILPPWDINDIKQLECDLKLQIKRINLYIMELKSYTEYPMKIFYELAILKQSFPGVYTKNRQFPPHSLHVKLLTGVVPRQVSFSPVICELVFEKLPVQNSTEKFMLNEVQTLDSESLISNFPLKFLRGTRKGKAYLKFSTIINCIDSSSQYHIESETSKPFVIITNESQWESAEEIIFKDYLFKNSKYVTFQSFCNTLQKHFLDATYQDLSHPIRCLSLDDFSYIHQYFFNNENMVSEVQVTTFWSWFGKNLKELRYRRYFKELWQNGYILGFIQREVAELILDGQPNGTFLIRFSERHPGQFAITYVKDDVIKHYLVTPEDMGGTKRTLCDFLSIRPQFLYIIRTIVDEQTGLPMFCRQTKKESLEKYYSNKPKNDKNSNDEGYESLGE